MAEKRRRRADSDDGRRQELIAAATRVIARDGVAAATTRSIVAEAGLPLGTFHYWFTSKEELLEEVLDAALTEMGLPDGENIFVGGPALFVDALRSTWQAQATDEPGRQLALYELTAFAIRQSKLQDLATRQYRRYRDIGSQIVEHYFDHSAATLPGGPNALGQMVSALFDGLVLSWLADPEQTSPDEIFVLLDHLIRTAISANPDVR